MTSPLEPHHLSMKSHTTNRGGSGESGHARADRVTHGGGGVQVGDTQPLSISGWVESGCTHPSVGNMSQPCMFLLLHLLQPPQLSKLQYQVVS